MKVKQLNNAWIPEEELKLWKSALKEVEDESFAIAMGWKKPEPEDLTQKFFFVNLLNQQQNLNFYWVQLKIFQQKQSSE